MFRSRNLDNLAIPADGNLSNAASGGGNISGPLLDIGETNSEAWSMDVLASDTESFRMRDFDPDDSLSVARSDDTRHTTFSLSTDIKMVKIFWWEQLIFFVFCRNFV